ncbi:hypothetical protein [Psychrobacter pacificensis]|jgi:Skp family chaperone for outer membrane proteins|uniref:Uncharacterized protein n=1 Tax=Psychrobacter pacificensis TaxID=112002 RepID=A0A1G6XLP9_9GAMM|nr:hypothetical protein [Psychrobacter pacificensis]GLR28098.1 hypothetical protein GCM10007915_03360 [Psychrobacter pacificensis]SDD78941.1 hypothetical protein SAMN05660405_01373 [Psychrobacter pacificensis]HBD03260.1 hypothetical protein [Psychrobacter sp.]
MKKNILSLVLGATLVLPAAAIAAPVDTSDIMPADMRTTPVDNTLQAEIEGPDGELVATQPGAVDNNNMDAINEDMESKEGGMDEDMTVTADEEMSEDQVKAELAQARATAERPTQMTNDVQSSQITPADMREKPVEITLQEKKKDRRGELLATQPGQVQFNENRRFTIR